MNGFKMDISGLKKYLDGIKTRMENPSPLMEDIGEILMSSTKERMSRGESPDGSKMEPVKRGGIPLSDSTLNLLRTISCKAGITDITIGAVFIGARVHQFGHTFEEIQVTVKNRKKKDGSAVKPYQRKRPSFKVPARPYLGISEDDKLEIADTVGKFTGGRK